MNKKGFTLVELLAVIVIISLLSSIAVISYTAFINKGKDRVYETYMDTMHAEAVIYILKNFNKITVSSTPHQLTLSELGIDPINNPNDKNDLCVNSYVEYLKNPSTDSAMQSIIYKVVLKCNDYTMKDDGCRTNSGDVCKKYTD